MPHHRYRVGDKVVLKSGAFRTGRTDNLCEVEAVLPDAYGLAQYRIRFETEKLERRVTEEDIDHIASPAPTSNVDQTSLATGGSWVNTNSIKIKR